MTRPPTKVTAPGALRGAAVLSLTLVACGGGAPSGGGATRASDGGAASTTGTDAAAATDGGGQAGATCSGPGYAGSASDQALSHLSATVVDMDGKAVARVSAQVCGTNVCVNGTTQSDGSILIDKTATLTKPAFKYGGGEAYAKFALPLTFGSSGSLDLGEQRTIAFDPPEQGSPLTPGTSPASRGVTLTLPGDMAAPAPDPFDFDTPALRGFRAAELPPGKYPDAVDASLGFEMVVALTPVGTELCPAVALTLPNSPGWKAGSAVELFLHGVDVAEKWAPYGGWAKVSGGVVSADGLTIETSPGEGLPALSAVGVRLAR